VAFFRRSISRSVGNGGGNWGGRGENGRKPSHSSHQLCHNTQATRLENLPWGNMSKGSSPPGTGVAVSQNHLGVPQSKSLATNRLWRRWLGAWGGFDWGYYCAPTTGEEGVQHEKKFKKKAKRGETIR